MNKQKSFTLIELLVVIVIIGVLAGVIMVTTSSSVSNATLARAKAFSSNVQNSMLLNLVSEWTFDEGDARDSWEVNDGTASGASPVANCVFGGCYSFISASSQYIDLNNSFSSITTSATKTISAWFKSNTINYATDTARIITLHKAEGSSAFSLMIKTSDDEIGLYYTDSSGGLPILDSNVDVTTNWTYVVGVQNGSSIKIYVDGIQANSANNGGIPTMTSPPNALIGAFHESTGYKYLFNGLIDDTRIYNAALSSSQIKQQYIAGLNSMLANGSISNKDYNERINALAYEE